LKIAEEFKSKTNLITLKQNRGWGKVHFKVDTRLCKVCRTKKVLRRRNQRNTGFIPTYWNSNKVVTYPN